MHTVRGGMERIDFSDINSGEITSYYVLEETEFGEDRFLLVTDQHPEDETALAHILRVIEDDDVDVTYEEVVDEKTLNILSGIFDELLEDTSLAV